MEKRSLEENTGTRGLHLENLQGIVNAFGGVIQNEARIRNVGIEQFVLSAAIIQITIINVTVFVDVVI
jgi:hypothetical protein